MRLAILIALPALVPAAAHADTWKPLPASEYVFQAVNIADAATTINDLRNPNLREANPILGSHPSTAAVVGFKIGAGAAHAAVTELMLQHNAPPLAIHIWEALTIGVVGAAVGNNIAIGARVKF